MSSSTAKKRIRQALAVSTAVLGLAVATSAQAQAGTAPVPADAGVLTTHAMETDDGNPGGRLEFRTLGDIVTVSDQQANDGHSAIGYVYEYVNSTTRGDRLYSLRDDGSDGVPAVARASDGGSHNLVEGRSYWFRICLIGDDGLSFCDWAAWSNQEPA
ncbi:MULTISPECIES: hypothetical protein [Streptomyces]|jgi:hypothetical protein|uniref:Secreted protein n=2 Tax=Streptomyces TaxID=1883 RepID=A0ABT9LCP0_STRGD|nr:MULTISPECIES: hypothetical protein [Streptomyces]MDP9681488.1 hypothetical protein [Streptomyces griseoviridis]GGS74216.1 hypothetical protein GCM10010240_04060 [Streptomyces griseoviridis]GGU44424.1 hypothetical protein GCM10010259_39280 [Streptomyces daghestanicus]GHI34519.1 hypothetical protein Sdagh_62490 [Streptomyces daghestanicus]